MIRRVIRITSRLVTVGVPLRITYVPSDRGIGLLKVVIYATKHRNIVRCLRLIMLLSVNIAIYAYYTQSNIEDIRQ